MRWGGIWKLRSEITGADGRKGEADAQEVEIFWAFNDCMTYGREGNRSIGAGILQK